MRIQRIAGYADAFEMFARSISPILRNAEDLSKSEVTTRLRSVSLAGLILRKFPFPHGHLDPFPLLLYRVKDVQVS